MDAQMNGWIWMPLELWFSYENKTLYCPSNVPLASSWDMIIVNGPHD